MQTLILGFLSVFLPTALLIKYFIFSVTVIGDNTLAQRTYRHNVAGVLPIIRRFANGHNLVCITVNGHDGSLRPLPLIYTGYWLCQDRYQCRWTSSYLFSSDLYLSFYHSYFVHQNKIAPHIIQADCTDYYYIQFRFCFSKGFYFYYVCTFYVRYIPLSKYPL